MHVPPHASQHDAIGDLPLVTESATVTDVTPMDRDRRTEIGPAVREWLTAAELDDEYVVGDTPAALRELQRRLTTDGYTRLARRVGAVAERAARNRPMLVRTQFETDRSFAYLAGQYVGVRYGDAARAYSLASSPNSETVEICVRRVADGRLSPRICGDLTVGDRVTLRGPHGDLVLQDHSTRDLAFLATGTGVAPFKGMIDYLFEEGLDTYDGERRDVWLFLGAAWEDDLPYRDAFRELAASRDNFHFVPTLSRESFLTDWDGETDYVQHSFLRHVDESAVGVPVGDEVERWLRRAPDGDDRPRLDPGNLDVYACGINAMVHGLVAAAERIGVPEERILSEGFG